MLRKDDMTPARVNRVLRACTAAVRSKRSMRWFGKIGEPTPCWPRCRILNALPE